MTSPPPAADPPAGDPPAAPPTTTELAGRIDQLAAAVTGALGQVHAGAQGAVLGRLDGPGAMAAVVREELDRRQKEDRDAGTAAKVESVAQVVAKLTETPPAQPKTRRHRLMGWGD